MNLPDQRERHAARYRNGMSPDDLRVIGALIPWFQGQGDCVHVTVAPHGMSDDQRHELFDAVRKRIAEYQRRSKMKRLLRVEVREIATEQGFSLHIHIICVFPDFEWARKFVESINGSKALKRLGEKAVVAVRIVDAGHWKRLGTYFTTEATMQAWVAFNKSFPKPDGPFHFDGDRVVPSPDAKEWLIRNERMRDWKRTNARRRIPASGSKIAPAVAAAAPMGDTDNTVQKQIEASPVPASPPISSPIRTGQQPISAPMQLGLFAALPLRSKPPNPQPARATVASPAPHPSLPLEAPPVSILVLIENKRAELGLSQREVAAKLGMKQPGYSNAVVRHHDKLGSWALRRAVEFLRLAA